MHTIPAVIVLWLTGDNGCSFARFGTGRIVYVPAWIANGCWAARIDNTIGRARPLRRCAILLHSSALFAAHHHSLTTTVLLRISGVTSTILAAVLESLHYSNSRATPRQPGYCIACKHFQNMALQLDRRSSCPLCWRKKRPVIYSTWKLASQY